MQAAMFNYSVIGVDSLLSSLLRNAIVRKASCCVRVRVFPLKRKSLKFRVRENKHEASDADSRSVSSRICWRWWD